MAGKSTLAEKSLLNTWYRGLSTAVGGGNASTTNILVTSSTGFQAGDVITLSTAGSLHRVTTVPDGTHVTISPAAGVAPTTGNLARIAYAPPAVYIGLFTAAPTDAGGGTEVTGGSYARVQIAQADASWAAPSGSPSVTSNSGAVTFVTATASWGTVTHFGIFDAVSGGTLIDWAILTSSQVIGSGATASFAGAALTITED